MRVSSVTSRCQVYVNAEGRRWCALSKYWLSIAVLTVYRWLIGTYTLTARHVCCVSVRSVCQCVWWLCLSEAQHMAMMRECHLCRVAGNTVWSYIGMHMWVPVAVWQVRLRTAIFVYFVFVYTCMIVIDLRPNCISRGAGSKPWQEAGGRIDFKNSRVYWSRHCWREGGMAQ